MDCKTARMLAELRGNRDSELPPEENAELNAHLNSCASCHSILSVERRIDAHFAKVMQAVPAPPRLKSKILDRLATERGALYRRRLFAVVAAAAAIFVAVGIFSWEPFRKTKLDLDGMVVKEDEYGNNPEPVVKAWLKGLGVDYQPAEPLDPHLIACHGITEIQGKQVPMIFYQNADRRVVAQVFVIRAVDFDVSNLPQTRSGSSGLFGRNIRVIADKAHPADVAYVVLFTGDSLDNFKAKPSDFANLDRFIRTWNAERKSVNGNS